MWRGVPPGIRAAFHASAWLSAACHRYYLTGDLDTFPHCLDVIGEECERIVALLEAPGMPEVAPRLPLDWGDWPTRRSSRGRPLTIAQLRTLQHAANRLDGLTRRLADARLAQR